MREVVQRLARLTNRHSGEHNAVGRLTDPGSRGRLFEVINKVASTITFGIVVGKPVIHFRRC